MKPLFGREPLIPSPAPSGLDLARREQHFTRTNDLTEPMLRWLRDRLPAFADAEAAQLRAWGSDDSARKVVKIGRAK
jgi:hypothetical protein